MRTRLFIVLFCFACIHLRAADSLQVTMSKHHFVKGDTVDFTCSLPYFSTTHLSSATLNVWIEDLAKTRRWKFRYPIIDGAVDAGLAVSENIPDGKYAVTFLVQRGFFRISGTVKDHLKKDTAIYYMMVQKNDQRNNFLDIAKVADDGSFRLKSTLFADSAFFVFTPAKKVKTNSLAIHIETPLDSLFTPVLQTTRFITVGAAEKTTATDSTHFVFNATDPDPTLFLPNVTVTARAKKKVQLYDEQYSSGLFVNNEAIVFDGLESTDIANSPSVLWYLQSRVPGLSIRRDEMGRDIASWRNEQVELYIDEFRVSSADYDLIPTSEIAMIKVYRPPAHLSALSGAAGAIAIYTKKGDFAGPSNRHNFIVKGYTPVDGVWR